MNAGGTITRSSAYIPKVSCIAAALSVLPVLWIFLAQPSADLGPLLFCLSVALAIFALVLGFAGLYTARPLTLSVSGIVLSVIVLLFWGFLLFMAMIAAMIALP